MKYICKDCRKEYLKRVEYCSCGNNEFEISETVIMGNDLPDGFDFENGKMKEKLPIDKGIFISWLIFSVCIVLSMFIICVPIKRTQKVKTGEVQKIQKNLPDIEKIWDSTPVTTTSKSGEIKTETKAETIFERVMNKIEEPPFIKDVAKQNTKPAKQDVKKQNTSASNVKPQAKSAQSRTNPENPKPVNQNPAQPKITQKPISQTSASKQQISKPAQNSDLGIVTLDKDNVQKPKVQTPKYDIKATAAYEAGLLKKLYSKFAVGGLTGSGTCVVSFSIDDNGKLADRQFVQFSDNKSLNDAVYYMMMSNPQYTTPPEGYYRRTLKVRVNYNDEEYSIGYI